MATRPTHLTSAHTNFINVNDGQTFTFGGSGGNQHADVTLEAAGNTQVAFHYGDVIDSIQFGSNPAHGGSGGHSYTYGKLDSDGNFKLQEIAGRVFNGHAVVCYLRGNFSGQIKEAGDLNNYADVTSETFDDLSVSFEGITFGDYIDQLQFTIQ